MLKSLLLFVLFLQGASCQLLPKKPAEESGSPPAAVASGADSTLSVLTYNIAAIKQPNIKQIGDVIAASGMNVAGLQEVDRFTRRNPIDQPRMLAEQLATEYRFEKAIPWQDGEFGLAVLSTFTVLEWERFDLPFVDDIPGNEHCGTETREKRIVLLAKIALPDDRFFYFATTHFGLCDIERTAAADFVAQKLGHLKPLILLGDFNEAYMIDTDDATRRVAEIFAQAGWRDTRIENVGIPGKHGFIDWILVDSCWQVDGTREIEQAISDHHPVLAHLTLKADCGTH